MCRIEQVPKPTPIRQQNIGLLKARLILRWLRCSPRSIAEIDSMVRPNTFGLQVSQKRLVRARPRSDRPAGLIEQSHFVYFLRHFLASPANDGRSLVEFEVKARELGPTRRSRASPLCVLRPRLYSAKDTPGKTSFGSAGADTPGQALSRLAHRLQNALSHIRSANLMEQCRPLHS